MGPTFISEIYKGWKYSLRFAHIFKKGKRRVIEGSLFCRSWEIQGHAFVPRRTGFFRDFRFFASRSDSHHMTGLTNDPFKGAGLAFRTFQVHSIIGTHKEFLKYVAAFKTSEFKDGH
jgi:hypothetical protein